MMTIRIHPVVGGVITLSLVASAAAAQVNCGDVITGKAIMTSNIVCGANDPAVTIDGGSLDMNGKSISGCSGDGILLQGVKSSVANGRVSGCGKAFVVGGTGKHKLSNVIAINNSDTGFEVSIGSDKNKFVNTIARDNGNMGYDCNGAGNSFTSCGAVGHPSDGFATTGEKTKYKNCVSYDNSNAGFRVDEIGSSFQSCQAINNGGFGFVVTSAGKFKNCHATSNGINGFDLADGSKISGSVATGNGKTGIRSDGGSISKCSMVGNATHGLDISAGTVKAKKLMISGSGTDGIHIATGPDHLISGCSITDSGSNEIDNNFAGAIRLTVSKNVVLESGGKDLRDAAAVCGSNDCSKNTFDTRSQNCIE